ncbi:hypothetical protein DL766_005219 [Monosporascus sp. MC13-8B]|uniref:DUF6923 domain-containing protein n=1 Tax=Monosporascus cannonballus TaxID=155416 RepID=A0ABY0HGM1_9PEZI|nr:hypothetical protein DL762_001356 [Monosporascus cannonballus]RYP29762.1 hypothetical protein DL766_005219 [Monosporascus sp. MC13-8B]
MIGPPTTVTVTSTVTAIVTPTCEPPTPLECDKYGYLIQYNSLYRVDLQTGGYEQVASAVSDGNNVNAIGYHPLDNYLYGIVNPTRQLIRISSRGEATVVSNFTVAEMGATANVGDVDGEGYFWFGGAGRTWHQVDLRRPGSATYGTIVARGTADTLGLSVADWVHIPAAGPYLWGVAAGVVGGGTGTTLMRFSLATKRWEAVARYRVLARGGYGALYGINNGTLYASNNAVGQIWAFNVFGGAPRLGSDWHEPVRFDVEFPGREWKSGYAFLRIELTAEEAIVVVNAKEPRSSPIVLDLILQFWVCSSNALRGAAPSIWRNEPTTLPLVKLFETSVAKSA